MLRFATYNIHNCIGRDGKYSPERIAQVIVQICADVVALQEITLDVAGDLIGYLERATGMSAVDGTMFDRGVGRYGNVLLSRHRIHQQRLHDLSCTNREPRGVIDAELVIGGCTSRILATHLGLTGHERKDQLRRLADLIADNAQPSVLLGDFNVWLGAGPFRTFRELGFAHTGVRSFPTWPLPILPLDRILARAPAMTGRCARHDTPESRIASDHFPIFADIDLAV